MSEALIYQHPGIHDGRPGGIGLLLDGAVNSLQWREARVILLLIFLLVLAAELYPMG